MTGTRTVLDKGTQYWLREFLLQGWCQGNTLLFFLPELGEKTVLNVSWNKMISLWGFLFEARYDFKWHRKLSRNQSVPILAAAAPIKLEHRSSSMRSRWVSKFRGKAMLGSKSKQPLLRSYLIVLFKF